MAKDTIIWTAGQHCGRVIHNIQSDRLSIRWPGHLSARGLPNVGQFQPIRLLRCGGGIQLPLKMLPDSSVSSQIRAGWRSRNDIRSPKTRLYFLCGRYEYSSILGTRVCCRWWCHSSYSSFVSYNIIDKVWQYFQYVVTMTKILIPR